MSALAEKLIKNSKIKQTAIITDSKVYGKKEQVATQVPMINVAMSGKLDGGLMPGMLMLAGPSKHFKTAFALLIAAAYMKKYPDAIMLFYDSEFGTPESYFESFGIDMNRIVHTPIKDVEELKFDIVTQLREIDQKDHVIVVIDSVGNLASKKEVEDAVNEKSVADMSRAKSLKSLFRIVTPYLNLNDIPMLVVNHTYKEIALFPKDVVSGGTGAYYSSDAIWIVGRRQDKDGKELQGYHFVIKIEKSRHVREGSKIPITVLFDGGINKWSGLMDIAEEGGYIIKPKVGWYEAVDPRTGEVLSEKSLRAKDIVDNEKFWKMMFKKTDLAKHIEDKYAIGAGLIMQEEVEDED